DLVACANGMLFFTAYEPATGRELWRSDGTEAGTTLIQEIVPGPGSPGLGGGSLQTFKVANHVLAFVANDGIHGYELWRSDGFTVNLLMDINPGPASSLFGGAPWGVANGLVMFAANDGVHGEEFWASDGWSTTRLVDDIAVGAGNSNPLFFTAAGGSVFFHANDNRTGRELWAI